MPDSLSRDITDYQAMVERLNRIAQGNLPPAKGAGDPFSERFGRWQSDRSPAGLPAWSPDMAPRPAPMPAMPQGPMPPPAATQLAGMPLPSEVPAEQPPIAQQQPFQFRDYFKGPLRGGYG